MNIQKLTSFFQDKKWKNLKKSDWVVVGLAGILLLIIAMPLEGQNTKEQEEHVGVEQTSWAENTSEKTNLKAGNLSMTDDSYAEYLEEKLENVLEQMEGVGKVSVMITMSDTGEYVVEKDTNRVTSITTEGDSEGGNRTVSESSENETTIYVEMDNETYPYVQKEKVPTVEGVVVVAQGGGNSMVVSNISDAVKALLPVEAHRIKVVKMCSKEE